MGKKTKQHIHLFVVDVIPSIASRQASAIVGGIAHVLASGAFPDAEQTALDHLVKYGYDIKQVKERHLIPAERAERHLPELYAKMVRFGIASEIVGYERET